MMHQAAATGIREVQILEEPVPEPGKEEILIRSHLSGMSVGTEMAIYKGTICNLTNGRWGYWTEYPIELGYELVGTVEKAGAEITDVKEGDRVVSLSPHGTYGVTNRFRYSKIPDHISDEEATLAVLTTTTTHGIRRAKVEYGDRVLVLGLGVVGILSALHARRSGAGEVFVADPLAWKKDTAAKLGFPAVFDPLADGFEEQILEVTDGFGMDIVIEASGHPSAFEPAFQAVRRGGKIFIQGTHTAPVSVIFSDYVLHKEITLIGTWSIGNILPLDPQYNRWNRRNNLDLAMDLIARGEIPVKGLVTHRFPFSKLPEIYPKLEKGELDYLQIILNY